MSKKTKIITLSLTSIASLVIPISIVANNYFTVENKHLNIVDKNTSDKYIDPYRTNPETLSSLDVPIWVRQHGKLDVRIVSESFDRVTFGVDLDTNGASFKHGGAFLRVLKENKETNNFERLGNAVHYEPNLKFGKRPWDNSLADGYREFSLWKTDKDENYKFQLYVGHEVSSNGNIYTSPSIIAKGVFTIRAFKEPTVKFSMRKLYDSSIGYIALENVSKDYFIEWTVETKIKNENWKILQDKRVDKISNISNNELRFSVNNNNNLDQDYRVIGVFKDINGKNIKEFVTDTITVYGDKNSNANNGNSAENTVTTPGYVNGNRFPKPPFQIC